MKTYSLTDNYVHKFDPTKTEIGLSTENLQVFYGDNHAIFDGTLQFRKNAITAMIGASGSGKSTFLRCLNRMNDDIATVQGKIMYQDIDINTPEINVYEMRKHVGMVFQRPNPFAKSIFKNISYPLRKSGIKNKQDIAQRVEKSLRQAALWDEVKDDLNRSALDLSGGQQQRLCIARTLAMNPDVLLLDEPASALDPISTEKLEQALQELQKNYTIIMVTHSMQQASRISDYTAFFHMGHILEFDRTERIFTRPRIQATEDYISGNFG
ncbi:Phosphate transport ATP-binding protein PstB [Pediococcus damnosus]|uniref:phosphate ABC transporter ATP-binding protein PstB n=1 Tax=Pediococcus damnosus TaxID=51663 RepID=UPI00078E8012|nr:phosphate ABC transporter ATP-binding protein PstB [Pediococcus damnosus]AMV60039.1 Phosphate transport ATP-binding protein PstB [Pediococcus damnosus]AMV64283.1 Phosphate transport ATP-binding protein PstB [Pediococcus damnosus]